jgi:hypothetical protein
MVAFAGEQSLGFQVGNVIFRVVQLAVQLFQQVVALLGVGLFLREMDVGIEIAGKRSELVVGADLIFGALAIAQSGLRGFLIAPEIGLSYAGFERFQAFAMRRSVKDNSEPL